jgi:hypothetical protein
MQANHSLGLHNEERLPPSGPEASQHNPEDRLRRNNPGSMILLGQYGESLPQSEVFEEEIASGAKKTSCQRREMRQQA